jgi:phosphoribosylformimino-5-aminoimidazole carboxamide ribotide isomerase
MDLYPAIDIRGGRCVRLHQGEFDQETVYADDPVEQALDFEAAGAGWIHVVDLDAALTGNPVNRDVIARLAAAVHVPVQTGGGVRSEEAARALFDSGVARVVLGTLAHREPDLVARLADSHAVAVGLDARSGEIVTEGWTARTGVTVMEMTRRFTNAGVEAFVVTDVGRDGTMTGPDVAGLSEVLGSTGTDVIASGGVGSISDLRQLAALDVAGRRLAGAIVGKAIYEGRFGVSDAVTALAGEGT